MDQTGKVANREHGNLSASRCVFVWVRNTVLLSGVLPVFQGLNYLNYKLQRYYLICYPTNKVVKSLYSDALA